MSKDESARLPKRKEIETALRSDPYFKKDFEDELKAWTFTEILLRGALSKYEIYKAAKKSGMKVSLSTVQRKVDELEGNFFIRYIGTPGFQKKKCYDITDLGLYIIHELLPDPRPFYRRALKRHIQVVKEIEQIERAIKEMGAPREDKSKGKKFYPGAGITEFDEWLLNLPPEYCRDWIHFIGEFAGATRGGPEEYTLVPHRALYTILEWAKPEQRERLGAILVKRGDLQRGIKIFEDELSEVRAWKRQGQEILRKLEKGGERAEQV